MSTAPYDNLEQRELAGLRNKEFRVVHAQRARKLRKRGERVWYSPYFQAYKWCPKGVR